MAVISVIVEQSEVEIVSGIPKTVAISTNIPSSIFYTLDGSEPTFSSSIYTSIIYLPIDRPKVILKVFATNGSDSSPVFEQVFGTNHIGKNARVPLTSGTQDINNSNAALYPFGTNGYELSTQFNQLKTHLTVDDPLLPRQPNGFDGDGYGTNFSNHPLNSENYSVIEINHDRHRQENIGYVRNKPTIEMEEPIPEETIQFTKMFDPRAMIIFQDFDKDNPDDPPQINKQFFVLDSRDRVRSPSQYYIGGTETAPISGSFLRAHYNPRTNQMNYYYLDTHSQKWIISTQEYKPTGSFDGNMAGKFFSGGKGVAKVFKWNMFGRRHLF